MKTLVIFGRSPFINTVDCAALAARFDTAAINQEPVPCKFLFSLFSDPQPLSQETQVFTHWEKPAHPGGQRIALRYAPVPFLHDETRDGFPCYAHVAFTASEVVNWALRQGYGRILLVGVDHVETDSQFVHWDGSVSPNDKLRPVLHRDLKSFIRECARRAAIYQTNPAVADDWNLPFLDLATLLD